MNNANLPAMPNAACDEYIGWNYKIGTNHYETFRIGLTKREHFASIAMQGLLSGLNSNNADHNWGCNDFAVEAVMCADALLAELEKQK